MATLIESQSVPLSLRDVAKISQTLAEDMQTLVFDSEGITPEQYFSLDGGYKVEYVDGRLQVLPMPDSWHQNLVLWLVIVIKQVLSKSAGAGVQFAPFKVQLDLLKYREPDVCVMLAEHKHRRHNRYWEQCDLAIEIISESNADHDWQTKRRDYAAAGIPEYWVVDPQAKSITQFVLGAGEKLYPDGSVHGVGSTVDSRVVVGLHVDVEKMFAETDPGLPAD